MGSVVAAPGIVDQQQCGILTPWPGTKPKSLTLQGKFSTTGPPGKSLGSSSCFTVFFPALGIGYPAAFRSPLFLMRSQLLILWGLLLCDFSRALSKFSLCLFTFLLWCAWVRISLLCVHSAWSLLSLDFFVFHQIWVVLSLKKIFFSYFSSPSGISSTCMLMSLWCPIFLWGPIHFFYCHKIYIKFTILAIFNCTV